MTSRERGGIVLDDKNNRDKDLLSLAGEDAYELGDYRDIQARQNAQQTEQKRLDRRVEKREWLEAQDEMKFSHSIQFNAVPDWSSHYIAYSNLKKL